MQKRPPAASRELARAPIPGRRRNFGPLAIRLVALVIVIAVLYLIAGSLFGSGGAMHISGATTINITNSTSFFYLDNSEYAISLSSAPPNAAYVQVELTRIPVFLNPTMYILLYLSNATAVNGAGQYADMQLTLVHSSGSSAEILLVPIPSSAYQLPTAGRISQSQTLLGGLGSQTVQTTTSATTVSTTVSGGSTTSQTTSATTTVQPGVNYTADGIVTNISKKSVYYTVMQNYSALYAGESSCSAALYNSTYYTRYGKYPSSLDTYTNITKVVPYALTFNISQVSGPTWKGEWETEATERFYSGPVITLTVNTTTQTLTNTTIGGIFKGLNYTDINLGYTTAKNVGNACGILVTSCSVC